MNQQMPRTQDEQLAFVKTMTLGAVAQAPANVQRYFEQARKDLDALMTEYMTQADGEAAITSLIMALPVFMADAGDKIGAYFKEKKAKSDAAKKSD